MTKVNIIYNLRKTADRWPALCSQGRGMIGALKLAARGLKDLFLPRSCCMCGRPLTTYESEICLDCFCDLPLTFFWDWRENPAFERIHALTDIREAATLFYFRNEAGSDNLMYRIKYNGGRTLGFRMGYVLGIKLLECGRFNGVAAVTAVPLHPLRKFRRGYNQAEVIAAGVASAMHLPLVKGLLSRTRMTASQATLKKTEKEANVRGAFRMNGDMAKKLADKNVSHILLIDDTLTTGATLSECARQLAEKFDVSAASLAYAGG